jgi:asparagine synthase (glutamine-hydrolysing)
VSDHYRTQHHTITLEESTLHPEAILELLRHFDQPFADTSLIPMYWISKAIRDQGIICTLSGDGGDEVFGGYPCFWWANSFAQIMRLPNWVQHSLARAGEGLTRYTQDLGRQIAKAIDMAQAGRQDSAVLLASLATYLSELQKQELVLPEARASLQSVYRHFDGYRPKGVSELEELSRRMTENLFAVGLPGDMLRKVDMMSMLASIEVRVPMLDENVVALGLGLAHQLKSNGRQGKMVLRTLAQRWLPPAVSTHPKHGFSIPLDIMLNERFHEMIADLLLAPDSRTRAFLSSNLVELWLKLFRRAQQGERIGNISRDGLYQRIFFVLALELWLRDHQFSW